MKYVKPGSEIHALDPGRGQPVPAQDVLGPGSDHVTVMDHRPAGDHGTAVAVTQPGGVGTPFNASSPPETLAAGSHTIVAVYSGDSDDTGSQGSLTYVVDQAAQAITTTSTPPTTLPVRGTYRPTATGGASGNPVTFTATGACTISGGVVTVTKAGTCTVQSAALGASSS
jgi:hypothetical protein